MTVAVLNPQDCLSGKEYRFSKQPLISPTKDPRNSNPNFNNNRSNRVQQLPNRTKRSPPRSLRNPPPPRPVVPKAPAKTNLVMGQVKILKRGEDLSLATAAQKLVSVDLKSASAVQKPVSAEPEKKKKGGAVVQKRTDPDLGSTERLGPEPGSVPVQIRLSESKNRAPSFYAGSAFVTSPPPSSLPLPAFFTKKSVATLKTDDATSDLRRILKLDML
ncbi:hypothetical protein Ddye_006115 [Dipteronia dyeriana]|uniref:Uncharacterized protein n=1 Tax=Dipteronia dyeriana TaxID=168575 RepID=A0AAD9XHY7_9ROSI|nr:hypothetical protein Ddye_006115 [Dipteronia dyeriana]